MNDQVAPGQLELVRSFVNTADIDEGTEEFARPVGLRRWLLGERLIAKEASIGEADLERAISLREALRVMLLSNNGGEPDETAIATLNAEADRTRPPIRFGEQGTGSIGERPQGFDGAVGRLVGIVLTSMIEGTWSRLKVCENEACRWAVYDQSKNHSKRWCSMSVCGSRSKAREYWRRQRSSAV